MLAAPVPVQASEWVFFRACGFMFDIDKEEITGAVKAIEAPNIRGFWVNPVPGMMIIDWKTHDGIICSSVYFPGYEHPLHVRGTAEEILEKLSYD